MTDENAMNRELMTSEQEYVPEELDIEAAQVKPDTQGDSAEEGFPSTAHTAYEDMPDEEVIALCREGDSVAVEYLLNKYKI